jgi:hypothetical protein
MYKDESTFGKTNVLNGWFYSLSQWYNDFVQYNGEQTDQNKITQYKMGASQGLLIVLTKFRYLNCYYYHWDYRSAGGLLVPEAHYHWDYRSAGGLLVPEAHYHWDYRSAGGLLFPEAHYHWDYRFAGGLLVPEAHSWFIRHIYVWN